MLRCLEQRLLATSAPLTSPRGRARRTFGPMLLVALLSACAPEPRSNRLKLTPCRVGEQRVPAMCGDLGVPENAEQPAGAQIPIRVAVLPASAAGSKLTPLLILVGGPGQAATHSGVPIARLLSEVRRHRDLVLVDQRGTGGSRALRCDIEEPPFAQRLSASVDPVDIAKCLETLGVDTTQFTTLDALDDYEAVREALGYTRWNLWGGSYGSRVALAYMQQHPDRIERVVLDGAAPTDIALPLHFAVDGQASLDAALSGCARTPECASAFPNLTAAVPELLSQLGAHGIEATVTHPTHGAKENIQITRDGFLTGLRTLLYSSELTALVPLALDRAARDADWTPFVAAVSAIMDLMTRQVEHVGMYLSVICAEDVPRFAREDVAERTRSTIFGTTLVEQARRSCSVWKAAVMPDTYYEPVKREHPTLILSGAHDPATPPRWGQLVAERLPHSRHVVAATSHGVTSAGCAPRVITEFLTSTEPLAIDVGCLAQLPVVPFFTRPTGP